MQLGQYAELELKEGKLVLSADLGHLAIPVLDSLIAKVESGEIDPVHGTDLDKVGMLKALGLLKASLS